MKRTPIKRTPFRSKRPESRRKDDIVLEYPKPSQVKREQPAVRVYADGREVCNMLTKAGRDEYARRKVVMHERQKGICILHGHAPMCPGRLRKAEMMYEHEAGRGQDGGHRDDRIEVPDPKTGEMKPQNGVAHPECNSWKASRRISYHDVP